MWHSKHGNRKCGSRLSQSPCRIKARTRQRRPFVISPWKGDVFVGGWLPDHASTYEPEPRPLARLLALWIPTDPNPIWQACHHPNTMTSQCRYAGELNEKDQNDQAQTSHTMELSKLHCSLGNQHATQSAASPTCGGGGSGLVTCKTLRWTVRFNERIQSSSQRHGQEHTGSQQGNTAYYGFVSFKANECCLMKSLLSGLDTTAAHAVLSWHSQRRAFPTLLSPGRTVWLFQCPLTDTPALSESLLMKRNLALLLRSSLQPATRTNSHIRFYGTRARIQTSNMTTN